MRGESVPNRSLLAISTYSWKPVLRWMMVNSAALPSLGRAYRQIYRLLVRFGCWWFRREKGTRAVYLTRGMTGRIVPGVSDIDFKVIGDWTPQERADVAKRYSRLARRIPLFDPNVAIHLNTPDSLRFLYATDPYHRFRIHEGKFVWKLLWGEDFVSVLPPLSTGAFLSGIHSEIKIWWTQFIHCVMDPARLRHDRIFVNSLCAKAVAEVLRMERLAAGAPLTTSREDALEAEATGSERGAFLFQLLACVKSGYRHFDGDLPEASYGFLLERLPLLYNLLDSRPEMACGDGWELDHLFWEQKWAPEEERHMREIVECARTCWGTAYVGARRVPGLVFAMDETLLVFEVSRPLSLAQLVPVVTKHTQGAGRLRRRIHLYLSTGGVLLQLYAHDLFRAWQAILTQGANPDTWEALRWPQSCMDGSPQTSVAPASRTWGRPMCDFVRLERGLFGEALDDPAVYRVNTLDFTRMFWKYLQLAVASVSAERGTAIVAQSVAGVRNALQRTGLPEHSVLEPLAEAYRASLGGARTDLGALLPHAVKYLKELPREL
jgi:hypothetical protein